MKEIKKALAQIKQKNRELNNKTKLLIGNARGKTNTSQWYMNDLMLQENITQSNIELAEIIEKLAEKIEKQDVRMDVRFDEEKETEVVEDEEDVLRRFKS